MRPAWWLLLVLLAFTVLYPATGLRFEASQSKSALSTATSGGVPTPVKIDLTFMHPFQGREDNRSLWGARLALMGHSAMTTLYVAAFQKDLTYEPGYPYGRLLALLEVVLTSVLGALLLLAVRRQFKR